MVSPVYGWTCEEYILRPAGDVHREILSTIKETFYGLISCLVHTAADY